MDMSVLIRDHLGNQLPLAIEDFRIIRSDDTLRGITIPGLHRDRIVRARLDLTEWTLLITLDLEEETDGRPL